MIDIILYFLAGIVQDFVFTLNLRYIQQDKKLSAGLTSFLTTIITMLVLYSILVSLDQNRSIIAIAAYALGVALGTVVAMKIKIDKRNEGKDEREGEEIVK